MMKLNEVQKQMLKQMLEWFDYSYNTDWLDDILIDGRKVMKPELLKLSPRQAFYLWEKCGMDAPNGCISKLWDLFGGRDSNFYQDWIVEQRKLKESKVTASRPLQPGEIQEVHSPY